MYGISGYMKHVKFKKALQVIYFESNLLPRADWMKTHTDMKFLNVSKIPNFLILPEKIIYIEQIVSLFCNYLLQ